MRKALFPAPPPASRTRPDVRPERLLDRLLGMPHLAQVIPRLHPDVLHRVVQTIGLEDAGEFLTLATPDQLTAVFDLDLWRANRPGRNERFDGERFGVWLEVLVQNGAVAAADQVAQMDLDLVVAGIAEHARVVDQAAGLVVPHDVPHCDLGPYRIVAERHEAWDAIIAILTVLDKGHPAFFQELMEGCRALSSSVPEIDGLDGLLGTAEQAMFDLAVRREGRRDRQGYVTPAQARAFLQMARQLDLGQGAPPEDNPLARAYVRELADADHVAAPIPGAPGEDAAPDQTSRGVAAVLDVLREAGVLPERPRPLLEGPQGSMSRVPLLEGYLRRVQETDLAVFATRNAELAYLVNTLVAGCSIQDRPLTLQEAVDASAAICNLGLESWPRHWPAAQPGPPALRRSEAAMPEGPSVEADLVTVFQVGFSVLHRDACLAAADGLVAVLRTLRYADASVRSDLAALRVRMTRERRAGAPWQARERLDVIQILDMPAWATLTGLIAELPVLHAAVGALRQPGTLSVAASAFSFIADQPQLAAVRTFIGSLAETLRE